ncbi:MAG: UvrD-helicase domain-containing protein [Proteobacteria bacterium]|nr:UvrD-helicase domain-containing protein [Pseudomonadota bacterium]
MSASTMTAYSPTEPLVRGITLLEASAGTGKTYNITDLVVRLVTEQNVKMREILVVTFTRAATAELKERIRVRIADAIATLEGRPADPKDAILSRLPGAAAAALAEGKNWLRQLRDAQEAFDECLISTIHGFCQRMLQQNAFESSADFGLELVQDSSALIEELVDDWLSAKLYPDDPERYDFHVTQCGWTRDNLIGLAKLALRDPDMQVVPAPGDRDEAGWQPLLDAFDSSWRGGWCDSLPAAIEEAHQRGDFSNPKQSKYRQTRATKEAIKLTKWLDSGPTVLGSALPPNVDYWAIPAPQEPQVDPKAVFQHPALDALVGLQTYANELAAGRRAEFVAWLVTEFDRRNRERRTQSFQDLMRLLARNLRDGSDDDREEPVDPAIRQALADAIGGRFKAALIDEFQDTDDLQWTIFFNLFGGGEHWLYLIGDPKQAIYGFRGANVHVYLAAKRSAGQRIFTMTRNYRSDQRYVEAMNHIMGRAGFFGEADIAYVSVDADPRTEVDRLRYREPWSDGSTAPLSLRFFDQRLLDGDVPVSDDDDRLTKGDVGDALPGVIAEDVVRFLTAGTRIHDPEHPQADDHGFRPVGPGDVAVLVRTKVQSQAVHGALSDVGVPAVRSGADNVYASDEARDLQLWLEALAAPGRDGPARAAATSRLFGRSAARLVALDAEVPMAVKEWDIWLARLARWREVVEKRGFLTALRAAMSDEDVPRTLLTHFGGERRLTNLNHVAELLHAAEVADRLHLTGLLSVLQQKRSDSEKESDETELRLDRDDEAVSILTMHKCKGLQFPIVFAPFLWGARLPKKKDAALIVPSEEDPTRRLLDLRTDDELTLARAVAESRKEALRLLYVAVTRAKHRCVLYTGHVKELWDAPAAPALHGEPGEGSVDRLQAGAERGKAGPVTLLSDLMALADSSGTKLPDGAPTIAVSMCEPPTGLMWDGGDRTKGGLQTREFLRRGLDRLWRRYSYTALTAGKQASYAVVEPELPEGLDMDAQDITAEPADDTGPKPFAPRYELPEDVESVPLARFPAGAHAGTFLHEIYELADFQWADPAGDGVAGRAALEALLDTVLPQHGFDPERWRELLADGFTETLRTPLGGPLGAVRLCDVPRAARFDELRFDFPIAGGAKHGDHEHKARVRSEHLIEALLLRAADERMRAPYLNGLRELKLGHLVGFMTGSIDLVFRHAVNGQQRWFVADYKSNRLDPQRQRRYPQQHFCQVGMRYEMEQHHYFLQYHIYALALHRYLRWRLGADHYDYDRDFGGIYYLFIRGMTGAETPKEDALVNGCFHDRPPREVIEALDRAFDDPPPADERGPR